MQQASFVTKHRKTSSSIASTILDKPVIQKKRPMQGSTWAEDILKVEASWKRSMEGSEQQAKRRRLNNNLESEDGPNEDDDIKKLDPDAGSGKVSNTDELS